MSAPRVSFEFFPPKSLEASFRLWDTVRSLAPLRPRFVSVTFGAGGTTRQLTHEAVTTIGKQFDLEVAAHLTCVDATRDETLGIAHSYADAGVNQIVALRGDPPRGADSFTPHPEGFNDSVELVEALAQTRRFTLRVGAYPERHPDAPTPGSDVTWLKRKLDAGADEAITQFFFDTDIFLRFRDACARAGIDKPIIPGVVPIDNWKGVRKFAVNCGATIPQWMDDAFEKAARDGREDLLATTIATEMCDRLVREGVEDIHFYTLNKAHLTRDVCHAIGIQPAVSLQQVA